MARWPLSVQRSGPNHKSEQTCHVVKLNRDIMAARLSTEGAHRMLQSTQQSKPSDEYPDELG